MQDAHEFLNFLLNELVDILEESKAANSSPGTLPSSEKIANGTCNHVENGIKEEQLVSWVHRIFQVSSILNH